MNAIIKNYTDAFKGLSTEVWWLSLVTLINRAGTMVIPFLSLYLTKSLDFTLEQVGIIMGCFGLGSVVGSWIGGKLTDKVGYFKVMKFSLFFTGLFFLILQQVSTYVGFCVGIFMVMLVADMFRPAIFVALSAYSKPENKTRSVTLIRLAINLGFSAGPAVGGLIIAKIGYGGLFWVDGVTCLLATFLLMKVLHPKKAKEQDVVVNNNPKSIFSDGAFWLFFVGMLLFGVTFFQYFSTMPLYYKDIHALSEFEIGMLLGMNGFVIFLLEMPLIKWMEDKGFSHVSLMFLGMLLTAISFGVLLMTSWVGILIIGMLFATVGEMIAFPFSNAFVMERAKRGKQGEYMAYYSIAFSVAHIFGHGSGMKLIDSFGFHNTWAIVTVVCGVGLLCFVILNKIVKKEAA